MAVAESVKAASDIYAPVSGKIISVNTKQKDLFIMDLNMVMNLRFDLKILFPKKM